MPANTLGKFIESDSVLARYTAQVQRLARLQQAYEQAVPAALVRSGRVANLKQGVVVIYALSGAAAVKLRQVAPRLTDLFRQIGPEINEVQVKVQPKEPVARTAPFAGGIINPQQKQSLERLSESLPSGSPLRRSLERFLRHSRFRTPE